MPTFNERVQALPPELYNEVLDLTFTPTTTDVFIIGHYQPSSSLRVSRVTRQKFVSLYHGKDTGFYVDTTRMLKWLKSLDGAKVKSQAQIRLTDTLLRADDLGLWDLLLKAHCEIFEGMGFTSDLPKQGDWLYRLRFQVVFGKPEQRAWMGYQDLDPADICLFADRDATEWCEKKFGASS